MWRNISCANGVENEFVKRTGHLDKPLTIEKETKVLKDGYRRYIVAKTVKMDKVPVVYDYQK